MAAAVHRGLGVDGTLPQAAQRGVQRAQYRGAVRRADPAARGAGRPAAAARRAPPAAFAARGAARAARLDHRTGFVAPPDHGRPRLEDPGGAPCGAARNAEARAEPPRSTPRRRRRAALLAARRYALEIAANYSQPFVTFMALVLGRLWNRLYDGVEFEHVEKLQEIGDGAEIIYVPCHRSHMDYLLLSYVIYRKGFAVPHIAAGVNLNLPVIGRFLRKGGAFFLRRSFKGDALYAAVFAKYLRLHDGARPSARILHRGRPQPHRAPAVAAHRHVVDDRAQLPARPQAAGGVRAGVLRLRAHRRGPDLHRRTLGPREGKGERARLDQIVVACCAARFGKVHVNLGQPIDLDELLQQAQSALAQRAVRARSGVAARLDRRGDRRSGARASPPGSTRRPP